MSFSIFYIYYMEKWTENEIKYLKENCNIITPTNMSKKHLNRTVSSIRGKIKSLNLITSFTKDRFTFDLNNKEHIYLMGFLWADGYLHHTKNRLELSIITDDFNDISNLFDTNCWTTLHRNRKGRKPQTTIGLYKKETCDVFRKNYNYIKKSCECPNFINNIRKDLLCYFIRGFFDGDGCFYLSKDNKQKQCFLAGSYDQDWSWIEKILNELGIKYSIKQKTQKKNHKYSIIYITKKDILTFGNYIYHNYDNDNIGIKRKYEKFLKIINF